MSTIDTITTVFTPAPDVPVVADGENTFNTNAGNWLVYWKDKILGEINSFTSSFNVIIGQINDKTSILEAIYANWSIISGVTTLGVHNTSTPTITGTDRVVLDNEVSFTFSAISYLNSGSIASYFIDWGDGSTETSVSGIATHTYTTGSIGDTFTINCNAVDFIGNPSLSTTHNVEVVEAFIDTPIDNAIELVDGLTPQNALASLISLPTAVSATIDTVEFKVEKISDGTIVGDGIQSTTTLTLLIEFDCPDMEADTEYRAMWRCRDTSTGIDSAWSTLAFQTLVSFSITPTEGGYATGDRRSTITITHTIYGQGGDGGAYDTPHMTIDGGAGSDNDYYLDDATDCVGKHLTFYFGEKVKVSKLYTLSNIDGTFGDEFEAQTSADGTTWTSAGTFVWNVGSTGNGAESTIPENNGDDYLRLIGTQGTIDGQYVYEIEFGE